MYPRGHRSDCKGMGTIGEGHSEKCEGQVVRFGEFLAFFCLAMQPVGRVKWGSIAFEVVAMRGILWCDHPQFSIGGAQHLKLWQLEDCFGRSRFSSPRPLLPFAVLLQVAPTMPRKEKKRRRTPKITLHRGKEEHQKEAKGEEKVRNLIPFEGKAKKNEEKEEKQRKKVQRVIPFEGKAKKEEEKEEKQGKKVQRIISFEGKAPKEEKKYTLATLFGERMLGSIPSDEVGVAPAAPATPRPSA